jgi:hypothetical protein
LPLDAHQQGVVDLQNLPGFRDDLRVERHRRQIDPG